MTAEKKQRSLSQAFEAIAFLAGLFVLIHQTVFVSSAQVVLIAAALAAMGVLPAGQIQRALIGRIER